MVYHSLFIPQAKKDPAPPKKNVPSDKKDEKKEVEKKENEKQDDRSDRHRSSRGTVSFPLKPP